MKKILCLAIALLMMVMALASCTGAKNDGKKLVIGATGPLTGDNASYGISVKKGAEIAVKEINAAGGINGITFELMFEDDVCDPTNAVNAYNTLMDKGMQVSLGAVTSGACVALTEEARKDGILMITPSGSQKECTQYDNCFRICFTDPDQGTYAADFISDNNVGKKVAIIYDKSNDYSNGIYTNFVTEAGKKNLEIVTSQSYTNQSNTDFSVQLQAVKESGADLLFLPIYYADAGLILTQAAQKELNVIFFGVDGMDGIIKQMGEDKAALTEGVMLLTPFAADSSDPKVVSFVKVFKETYNNETPDQFAADGYDAIYAIAEALKYTGITDTTVADLNEKMVGAMTNITLEGVTGKMTWSADGEASKSATAVVINNSKYVAYSK
ncbi:MAG: ABC transporter substrate-binding protein [Lachnospiraceae bacterium]|nr:ABC transporter substrate-binding protein [Lachnospiraceae bacterium]